MDLILCNMHLADILACHNVNVLGAATDVCRLTCLQSAEKLMELFDKVVDQTLAFMRDYQVDPETGSWVKWDVPSFKYVKNTPFFHLVVPTVDSTRMKVSDTF